MNDDEETEWGSEFDAYIDAYVEDELADDEEDAAAAAYERFEQEQVAPVLAFSGRTRGVVIAAGIAAALAAGLASLWLWSGQHVDASSSELPSGGLAQDVVETGGREHVANSIEPRARQGAGPTRSTPNNEAEPIPETTPTPDLEPPVLQSPKAKARAKRQPKVKRVAPKEPEASRLSEELQALKALRQAARGGKYARALELAKQHRAGFDKPSLAAERDLIELEALCGLNRISDARSARAKFLVRHASHHLRVKAEEMCRKKLDPAQNEQPSGHPTP